MVEEEESREIMEEVLEEDLQSVLHNLEKDKSSGMDG